MALCDAPQLFVSPDFDPLNRVLDEFAERMALQCGGIEGISKAIASGNPATCVYSSGLQVSETFTDVLTANGEAAYLKTSTPTTLNYSGKLLQGHGKDYHTHGFGSPLGKLKELSTPPEPLSDSELAASEITPGRYCGLVFESGVKVSSVLQTITRIEEKLALMTLAECLVSFNGNTLFEPSCGLYDMAIGERIISAY